MQRPPSHSSLGSGLARAASAVSVGPLRDLAKHWQNLWLPWFESSTSLWGTLLGVMHSFARLSDIFRLLCGGFGFLRSCELCRSTPPTRNPNFTASLCDQCLRDFASCHAIMDPLASVFRTRHSGAHGPAPCKLPATRAAHGRRIGSEGPSGNSALR